MGFRLVQVARGLRNQRFLCLHRAAKSARPRMAGLISAVPKNVRNGILIRGTFFGTVVTQVRFQIEVTWTCAVKKTISDLLASWAVVVLIFRSCSCCVGAAVDVTAAGNGMLLSACGVRHRTPNRVGRPHRCPQRQLANVRRCSRPPQEAADSPAVPNVTKTVLTKDLCGARLEPANLEVTQLIFANSRRPS